MSSAGSPIQSQTYVTGHLNRSACVGNEESTAGSFLKNWVATAGQLLIRFEATYVCLKPT